MSRRNFKTCQTVVVEPTDQPMVETIGNCKSMETGKNLIKMCSGFRRKMIGQSRRQLGCGFRARHPAVVGGSKAIELECQAGQGQIQEQAPQQHNDLDICARVRRAKGFDTELMELPESPCLRPFVTEHRAEIEIFLWKRIGRSIMLDERTDCASRTFRAQGQ